MKTLIAAALIALAAPAAAQEAHFAWFDYSGSNPADAAHPPGPNDYRNPILSGFYPDPSIVRVGEDYYLVNSTFTWFPGLPIFHSRDLVHWTQIGNAIDRPGQLDFGRLGLSRGVFAPAISWHDGLFYLTNTCVDCGGNYVITARDPAGPWSDPVWLRDIGGIDPSLFFDDDGRAWLLNNDDPPETPRYSGHRAIWIQEFDTRTLQPFGPRRVLLDGGVDPSTNPIWIEGPHILKVDGWYYLICAEGGTAVNHSQVALRSRNVTGPYVPGPNNPILTQRDLPPDRSFPITSAGHAQLVQTQNGDWWATFLAVRPYADDFYNTGRETFLMPVEWRDGWPHITEPGEAVPYVHARPDLPSGSAPPVPTAGPFHVRDEFDGRALPPYWMMMRNPRGDWYRLAGGDLVLQPRPVGLGDNGNPSFLARRQQHLDATAETEVTFQPSRDGQEAGLAALQNDDYWYAVAVGLANGRRVLRLRSRTGPDTPAGGAILATAPAPDGPVRLRVSSEGATYRFAFAGRDGQWHPIGGDLDGSMLSTHVAGGFVGAVFGVYAVAR